MEKILNELVERYPQLRGLEGKLATCCQTIIDSYQRGNKLLIAGNGGSCADAEHIAGELLKSFKIRRKMPESEAKELSASFGEAGDFLAKSLEPGLPCIVLSAHIGFVTACCNDINGEVIYAQQLYSQAKAGDVFLGLSTSGNAKNIYYAMMLAKSKGVTNILFTGNGNGRCEELADVIIDVPELDPYLVQELHLPIYHAVCRIVEESFYGN